MASFEQTPDWRWQRAKHLGAIGMGPSRSRDDALVRRAYRFNRRQNQKDARAEERLAADEPELFAAFQLYDDADVKLRCLYEASVLADRPRPEMAQYLRIPVAVLEVYEPIFFDVRSALGNGGWIAARVLGAAMTNQAPAYDPDTMWKTLAYYGSWEAVKASYEVGHMTEQAMVFYRKACFQRRLANCFTALHSTAITPYNALETAELEFDMSAKEQQAQLPTPASGGDPLHVLMSAIRFDVCGSREALPAEEPPLQFKAPPDSIGGDESK